ncbi:egg cell-secreted protein 1.2-like [Durio zibethinus]|uniref:Egg cell-secreted protein 1.2-like n=1 Tax=Durio zibethinus TaxID=66656 RepID=A0A6P6BJG5_DURZI|nr:egg cell-secreted protein 1.2-like [Durio zibethinus]
MVPSLYKPKQFTWSFPHLSPTSIYLITSLSFSVSEMASISFRVFFFAFLLALSLLFMANARQVDDFEPTTTTDLMARLKLDEESTNCWDSLIQLQSCTGELIMFFLNGETDLGHSCCQAIRTISHQCWPSMIDALGFTKEETHVLEGYCDHEDDQSPRSVGSSKLLVP